MKVLHVIPSLSERSGGPAQALVPMCRALRDRGIDVLLAATDADLKVPPELRKLTTFKNLPAVFFPAQVGSSFKYSRPFANWLAQHVPDFNLVHIHAVFNHACIAAASACRKAQIPYIVRPLGTLAPWSMGRKSWRKKLFWQTNIRKMLANAVAIHYTTEAEMNTVEESLGLTRGEIIPLGVDLHLTANDPSLALPVPQPYVLVLSRLDPKKALDVLLEAFLSLAERGRFQSWHLVVAGDGPPAYVAKLKQITRGRLGSDRIVFTGWLEGERKKAALTGASLLALASHHENFGLCVMESLACGVPVLISPNVDVAREIQNSESGWVSAIDKKSLESTLATALSSPAELQRRGRNGKLLAQNYSWSSIAEQLSRLYTDIVTNRSAGLRQSDEVRSAVAGL